MYNILTDPQAFHTRLTSQLGLGSDIVPLHLSYLGGFLCMGVPQKKESI